MIQKSQSQLLKALQKSQERHNSKLFVAEGSRLVLDLLKTIPLNPTHIYCTSDWFSANEANLTYFDDIILIVSSENLKKHAALSSTHEVIAIFKMPAFGEAPLYNDPLSIYLEDIRDPSNLGSILRIADWFGINCIYGTKSCVDVWNNKSIQVSMSSVARVQFITLEVSDILDKFNNYSILGTVLNGQAINPQSILKNRLLCLGNEANGISSSLKEICTEFITIAPHSSLGAESLNVAIAAGILIHHYKI